MPWSTLGRTDFGSVTIQSLPPRAARCYALRPSLSGSCPRPCDSEQASGMIIDGAGQEGGYLRGRPAHDHWMNSPSSGQHTAHYSPVIIATFVDQFIALGAGVHALFF